MPYSINYKYLGIVVYRKQFINNGIFTCTGLINSIRINNMVFTNCVILLHGRLF